ncbi:hypothetical protein ACFSVK_22635 [Azorhizophilus paspali]|uniref:hypothetical protein n=1 Tax=Azorhizophilus paspali TaxID=69963 RepID=UPI003632987D
MVRLFRDERAVREAALRAGHSNQPQPTIRFGVLTHSQWTMAIASAERPSHLCSR